MADSPQLQYPGAPNLLSAVQTGSNIASTRQSNEQNFQKLREEKFKRNEASAERLEKKAEDRVIASLDSEEAFLTSNPNYLTESPAAGRQLLERINQKRASIKLPELDIEYIISDSQRAKDFPKFLARNKKIEDHYGANSSQAKQSREEGARLFPTKTADIYKQADVVAAEERASVAQRKQKRFDTTQDIRKKQAAGSGPLSFTQVKGLTDEEGSYTNLINNTTGVREKMREAKKTDGKSFKFIDKPLEGGWFLRQEVSTDDQGNTTFTDHGVPYKKKIDRLGNILGSSEDIPIFNEKGFQLSGPRPEGGGEATQEQPTAQDVVVENGKKDGIAQGPIETKGQRVKRLSKVSAKIAPKDLIKFNLFIDRTNSGRSERGEPLMNPQDPLDRKEFNARK